MKTVTMPLSEYQDLTSQLDKLRKSVEEYEQLDKYKVVLLRKKMMLSSSDYISVNVLESYLSGHVAIDELKKDKMSHYERLYTRSNLILHRSTVRDK